MKLLIKRKENLTAAELERNIVKLRLARALMFSVTWSIPTLYTFWGQYGLTMTKMMLLEAVFGLTMVFTEIPAGVAADRFGRKCTITIGAVLLLFSAIIYAQAASFGGFLLAEICIGAGMSFVSGADESLLYDSLRALNRSEEYESVWSKVVSAEMLYCGLCFLLGGTIAAWNIRLPFYLMIAAFVMLIAVTLTLHEPLIERERQRIGTGEILRTARIAFFENSVLKWLLCLSAFLCSINQAAFWLYQPYFKQMEIPLIYNGAIYFGLSMVTGAIAIWMTGAERKLGALKMSTLVIMGTSFCLMLTALTSSLWIFLFIPLIQSGRAFYRVSVSHYLHREADSRVRATMVSTKNMVDRIFYSIVLLGVGWLVDNAGLSNTFAILGSVSFFFGALILISKPKRHASVVYGEQAAANS